MTAPVARRLFTVAEYEQMGAAGILHEDDRVELLAGEIVQLAPIGPDHVWRVNVTVDRLVALVRGEAFTSVQNPIRLSEDTEPQPDIVLIRRDAPRNRLPGPDDVLLVIEVADTSLDKDRAIKLPLYAAAGIAEAWLVDLVSGAIEQHTDPFEGQYRRMVRVGRGETLTSTVLLTLTLAVDDILG